MAVSYSSFAGYTSGGAGTSANWSHTIASLTDAVLVITLILGDGAGTTVDDVTVNATSATFFNRVGSGASHMAEVWHYVNPPTGAQTVAFDLGGSHERWGWSSLFSGADQTTPLEDFQSTSLTLNTSTNPDIDVTVTSATGDMAFGVVSLNSDSGGSWDGGETEIWAQSTSDTQGGAYEAGAASVNLLYTSDYGFGDHLGRMLGFNIAAAGAADQLTLLTRGLHGGANILGGGMAA